MVKWLKNACFYEIYPQSFKDTNDDGIGDLNGIIEKLDYIKELGCNALWINPCFDSPFKDAGYDVRNYKLIAPRYGTNEDAKRLFEEAHSKGIHVLLDLVVGHTSYEHEWFKKSALPEANEYSGRYIWTDDWLMGPKDLKGMAGMTDRNGVYIVNFFATQPALNYGFLNPTESWQQPTDSPDALATIEAVEDIMDFWLSMGCDGFRVDMAESLVKHDNEKKSGTSAVWRNITGWMKEKFPEAVMVSEWNNPTIAIPAGFDMDFMLNWHGNGYDLLMRDCSNTEPSPIFKKNSKRKINEFLDDYLYKYEAIKDAGKYCLITGNHDTQRLSYYLDETERKLAFAFILTMPGAPFIYYGDEVGMRYQAELINKEGGYTRTGSRTPMQWDTSLNMGFSGADSTKLYLPVDTREAAKRENVKAQMEEKDSLYQTVRRLLELRKETPELLEDNNLEFVYPKHSSARINEQEEDGEMCRAFVYKRGDLMIFVNPDESCAQVPLEELSTNCQNDESTWKNFESGKLFELGSVAARDGKVILKGQSFAAVKIKR